MNKLSLNQDIKPLSEFRSHATAFIQQVRSTQRPIVITQHGRSTAVLMDVSQYDTLMEKLELLQDIQTAEIEIKQGKGIPHDKAKKWLLERLPQ